MQGECAKLVLKYDTVSGHAPPAACPIRKFFSKFLFSSSCVSISSKNKKYLIISLIVIGYTYFIKNLIKPKCFTILKIFIFNHYIISIYSFYHHRPYGTDC